MTKQFKEWDRVHINYPTLGVCGKGTVLEFVFEGDGDRVQVCIRTDKQNQYTHGCNGLCTIGHGLYVSNLDKLTLITNK